MNNRRAVANYLADMRADCRTAAGAAVISGLPEVGKVLAWIASAPLDKLRGMRYTEIIKQPAQRAEKQEGNKMKIYEYTISWTCKSGIQIAHAYCIAASKSEAKQKISKQVPYKIGAIKPDDLGTVQSAEMLPKKAAEIGNHVKLWYFDADGNECTEFF